MAYRITKLSQSACYNCPYEVQCEDRVNQCHSLQAIVDYVFPRKGLTHKDCTIAIVIKGEIQRKRRKNK